MHADIEVVLVYQDVLETVQNGYQELGENADDTTRVAYKDARKKDRKILFLIHQSVDNAHFRKIASAKIAMQAWDILVKCYDGADKLNEMKLQTLRRQFELLRWNP